MTASSDDGDDRGAGAAARRRGRRPHPRDRPRARRSATGDAAARPVRPRRRRERRAAVPPGDTRGTPAWPNRRRRVSPSGCATPASSPLSVGRVIVATWEPNEGKVLDAIRELGLELQIIFNKGAVMVLPAGVNKESGLRAALDDTRTLPPLNCVGGRRCRERLRVPRPVRRCRSRSPTRSTASRSARRW